MYEYLKNPDSVYPKRRDFELGPEGIPEDNKPGIDHMSDGSTFEGCLVNGKRSGHGKLTFAGGVSYYEGDFEEGEITGEGFCKYSESFFFWVFFFLIICFLNIDETYRGGFKNGRRDGNGLWIRNGEKFEGLFSVYFFY